MLETEVALYSHRLTESAFGPIDTGPDLGSLIYYYGGLVRDIETGELFNGPAVPGEIVGYCGHCPIIAIEGEEGGFLGLPPEGLYRYLGIIPEFSSALH